MFIKKEICTRFHTSLAVLRIGIIGKNDNFIRWLVFLYVIKNIYTSSSRHLNIKDDRIWFGLSNLLYGIGEIVRNPYNIQVFELEKLFKKMIAQDFRIICNEKSETHSQPLKIILIDFRFMFRFRYYYGLRIGE